VRLRASRSEKTNFAGNSERSGSPLPAGTMIDPDVSLSHSLPCARNGQPRVLVRFYRAALRARASAALSMVAVSAAHCGCWAR
jgi:hypothetical protein